MGTFPFPEFRKKTLGIVLRGQGHLLLAALYPVEPGSAQSANLASEVAWGSICPLCIFSLTRPVTRASCCWLSRPLDSLCRVNHHEKWCDCIVFSAHKVTTVPQPFVRSCGPSLPPLHAGAPSYCSPPEPCCGHSGVLLLWSGFSEGPYPPFLLGKRLT